MKSLKYHKAALDLVNEVPKISPKAIKQILECEKRLKINLPPSFREWYSLEGAVELLEKHSNSDHPISLEDLGIVGYKYFDDEKYFFDDNKLVFMVEHQGVCRWAIAIDGNDDPKVLVRGGYYPELEWVIFSETFSNFIYCQIWDYGKALFIDTNFSLNASDIPLKEEDLRYLKKNFKSKPQTYMWPGKTNYRFYGNGCYIIIFDNEKIPLADWWISAESSTKLKTLIEQLWNCGTLKDNLNPLDDKSAKVLKEVK